MAHHAFDFVTYDPDTEELTIIGSSNRDLGGGAEIHFAIIDVKNENRRREGRVEARVGIHPWTQAVTSAPSPYGGVTFPPFKDGDVVFAAGMSKDDNQPVFVWAEQFTIGLGKIES